MVGSTLFALCAVCTGISVFVQRRIILMNKEENDFEDEYRLVWSDFPWYVKAAVIYTMINLAWLVAGLSIYAIVLLIEVLVW